MPRELTTYVTIGGFFELAVAAPTKKAALEIWGAGPDLFQRGYAKQTDDPAIVKAAMAKPGVVLQRGVGSNGPFKEHAELSDISLLGKGAKKARASKRVSARKSEAAKPKQADPVAGRKAARLYGLAREARERRKARTAAAERRASEIRNLEIRKAETALEAAQEKHSKRIAAIESKLAEFERKAGDEDERWKEERQRLEDAVRTARG